MLIPFAIRQSRPVVGGKGMQQLAGFVCELEAIAVRVLRRCHGGLQKHQPVWKQGGHQVHHLLQRWLGTDDFHHLLPQRLQDFHRPILAIVRLNPAQRLLQVEDIRLEVSNLFILCFEVRSRLFQVHVFAQQLLIRCLQQIDVFGQLARVCTTLGFLQQCRNPSVQDRLVHLRG